MLIPAPDYPLWTAMTSLGGGTPVHYLCDEQNGWQPDIEDIRSKITERTKAIVVINPNTRPVPSTPAKSSIRSPTSPANTRFWSLLTRSTTASSSTMRDTSRWPPLRRICWC